MSKEASVKIELSQTHNPSVTGRNGIFDISHVCVWERAGRCFIDPISKETGNILNAGMVIAAEDMDHLAKVWLQVRGEYPRG